jgi:hypothetical protein
MWEHAEKLRQRGGFRNKSEANRLEAWAAMAELGEVDRIFPFYQGHPELSTQDLALAFFFDQAFELGQRNIRLLPISEVRKQRDHYLWMAQQLRVDAVEQERLGFYEGHRMLDAAFAYEELASAARPPPGNSLLVARQLRGDARLKGFVIALGDITKNVFGTPLYGTIASTANVVFSRDDLTADAVRKMLSHAPRP